MQRAVQVVYRFAVKVYRGVHGYTLVGIPVPECKAVCGVFADVQSAGHMMSGILPP